MNLPTAMYTDGLLEFNSKYDTMSFNLSKTVILGCWSHSFSANACRRTLVVNVVIPYVLYIITAEVFETLEFSLQPLLYMKEKRGKSREDSNANSSFPV